MKILFAIQATGNGHISRAREVLPHLLKHGEVDVLTSGRQAEVSLPVLIKYRHKGIGFTFGKKGGIDIIDSVKHLRPFHFIKDILNFPVEQYDLVINDFEPVTAWACKLKGKPCIALSHQSSFLSKKTPRPVNKDAFAEGVFRHYAPSTAQYGFHFKPYDHFIYTPVIRKEIRRLEPQFKEHITVYLPAHADNLLIPHFKKLKEVKWHIFSKHSRTAFSIENIEVKPVTNEAFTASLAAGNGLLTAGGFESPAEAIYLRKKVLSVPMHNQYEQLCNAEAMKGLGITVVKKVDDAFASHLSGWLNFAMPPAIHYADHTERIVEQLVSDYCREWAIAF
jgi:uncharacterized protein (TIGR00661 family)